ncbi:MAG: hypothetical protein IBJ02_03605 [Brevundimonas sp.]|nr:hypothetical protein [Brevundimonas sp.]
MNLLLDRLTLVIQHSMLDRLCAMLGPTLGLLFVWRSVFGDESHSTPLYLALAACVLVSGLGRTHRLVADAKSLSALQRVQLSGDPMMEEITEPEGGIRPPLFLRSVVRSLGRPLPDAIGKPLGIMTGTVCCAVAVMAAFTPTWLSNRMPSLTSDVRETIFLLATAALTLLMILVWAVDQTKRLEKTVA